MLHTQLLVQVSARTRFSTFGCHFSSEKSRGSLGPPNNLTVRYKFGNQAASYPKISNDDTPPVLRRVIGHRNSAACFSKERRLQLRNRLRQVHPSVVRWSKIDLGHCKGSLEKRFYEQDWSCGMRCSYRSKTLSKQSFGMRMIRKLGRFPTVSV